MGHLELEGELVRLPGLRGEGARHAHRGHELAALLAELRGVVGVHHLERLAHGDRDVRDLLGAATALEHRHALHHGPGLRLGELELERERSAAYAECVEETHR